VNCGTLKNINFGKVTYADDRTTYNATAVYVCDENYTLVGSGTRRCAEDGKWNGTEPRCEYVECGRPLTLENGTYTLLDDLTTYQSRVSYRCNDNFTIIGHDQRSCLETGKWSGREPTCKLIECGEPEIPDGAEIPSNATFTIHSEIHFRCKPGHKISAVSTNDVATYKNGGTTLKCNPDGKCCGLWQSPASAPWEVQYINGTTHLSSIASYSCNPGFRMIGSRLRVCSENGKWSDNAPKCE
ncbi:CUB and sushi domain-containing protein 3, partial [Trichonephila inaurata madagascariensis]